jgi:hypothetical protein
VRREVARAGGGVEVVGQGNAVPGGELLDFMLAVAVEGGPVDGVARVLGSAPVERDGVAGVAYDQLSSLVVAGQADDERAKLGFGAGSVDVRFEETGRGRVDLGCG